MQYYEQVIGTLKLKSVESQQLLKMYLQASPALQSGLMFGVLLSLRETDSEVQKVWEIPPQLLKNIRAYGFAMILAPGLGAYKANSAKLLLGLLYKHSLAGLPPDTDRARSSEVETRCSTVLGECRSAVKAKLIASVDELNGKTCQTIGELCEELVKGTDIVLTIQHHARIAWLRLLLRTQKISNGNKFWDEVDLQLKDARQKHKGDAAKLSRMFSKALKLDHKKYGEPLTPCPKSGGPEWQASIEEAAFSLVPYKRTR